MTERNLAGLLSQITTLIADNTTQDVTALDVRTVLSDIAESCRNLQEIIPAEDVDLADIQADIDNRSLSDHLHDDVYEPIRPDFVAPENEFLIGHPDGSGDITTVAGDVALARISDALLSSEGVVSGTFDLVMSAATPVYTRTLEANSTLDNITGASLGQAVFLDLIQDDVEEYTFEANATNFDIPASGLDNDLTASSVTRYWIRPLITGKHIIRRITEVA